MALHRLRPVPGMLLALSPLDRPPVKFMMVTSVVPSRRWTDDRKKPTAWDITGISNLGEVLELLVTRNDVFEVICYPDVGG